MSAILALKAARGAGVRVGLDNDNLALVADVEPHRTVLDGLARYRNGVVALLRVGADGWSGEDWLAFFDERAAIAEYEGGLSRADAEEFSFRGCVAEWLNRNPVRSPPGRCVACGGSEDADERLLPFGTERTGHVWLHSRCWETWQQGRKAQAVASLATFEIHAVETSP